MHGSGKTTETNTIVLRFEALSQTLAVLRTVRLPSAWHAQAKSLL